MTEIVPGITLDVARTQPRPIEGTSATAAEVLAWLAAGRSEAELVSERGLTEAQIREVLRYATVLAQQNLDATFAAIWADPDRNAAEAESDRRADEEIDAGGGFRGSIDELVAAVDAR